MVYLIPFLSVFLGYAIAVIFQKRGIKHLNVLLAFSGAFLLSTTLFEVLPEVFEKPTKKLGVFVMVGILLQIVLDFFSKGAEHGHVHIDDKAKLFPWLFFISLSLHALIEGAPVAMANAVMLGVVVHKIPIVIILSLFFLNAGYSRMLTVLFMVLFALMTPLGTFFTTEMSWVQPYLKYINAIAIGVFLHVSTTILFESNKDHRFNLQKLAAIIVGVVLAFFV